MRDTPVNQFLQHRTCWRARYDTFQDVDLKVPIGLKFVLPPHSTRLPDPSTNIVPGRFTRAEAPRAPRWVATVPRGAPGEPLVNGNPPRGGEKRPTLAGGPADIITYGPADRELSTDTTVLFWMTDDTGADVCSIQERDLEQIYHVKNNHEEPSVSQAQPPMLAYYEMRGASAGDPHKFVPCRAMRIHCYADKDVDGRLNTMLKEAELIEVLITKNSLNPFDPPVRLLGPWLRHRFYTATTPDRSGHLYIFKRHIQLITVPPSNPPLSGAFPVVNNLRIGPEHPAAEQDLIVPP
ncbi:hypothetical protein N7488_000877 [Penicillium malachiteum]|nr:hypothetical protein N7488_000877 [Penicillium malachiteum]